MDESHLRSLRPDVESNVDVPDFALVAARGARIRRRRTVAAGVGTALVVAVTALGVARVFDNDRPVQPVEQPAPRLDERGARRILSDPDAQVDPQSSRVNGVGDMLAVVVVPTRSFSNDQGSCPGGRTALRWSGSDGAVRAWVDRPRAIEPVQGGFVVAAVPKACRSGDPAQDRAYLVDRSGRAHGIAWKGDAEPVCSTQPDNPRCVFDVATASGRLTGPVRLPRGAVELRTEQGETLWARSADSRRLFWSEDGVRWSSRSTGLPPGAIVSAAAAGRWAVLAGNTSVEFTSDGGVSWHRKDLTAALRPVRIADVDWTVTRTGTLLGVTQLVGRGDVLFRSTDRTWTQFVEADVHTSFGLVRPQVEGAAVYVVDDERWAVSTDDGATWRRTPGLPRP